MTFARILLAFNAAFVLLSGIGCFVAPASLARQIGMSEIPGVLTEIRAIYGGLLVGIGCFLVWCLRRRTAIFAGLLLQVLSVGGAGLARAIGMMVDRDATPYHLMNLAIEVTTVVLGTIALGMHRRLADA